MQIHALDQGTDAWNQFRLTHYGASEAAAMLGLSKNAKRSELLRLKHLGDAKEFSRWVQENILDHGHEVEAMARPLVEEMIGDELYPVTCSAPLMPAWASYEISASCDGLTMGEDIAFEHKQYNAELFASAQDGIVPEEHMPQCQQVLMVTGAAKLYFVVSDGTKENFAYAVVTPNKEWQERIIAGWCQFDKDLAGYQLPEAEKILAAEPVKALPAVSVQVSGQISIKQNFEVFEAAFRGFLDTELIRTPETDQDFVDLDVQIKQMIKAEEALDAAEAQMLSQISAVDDAKRHKDLLRELVRANRLMAEKLFESEKKRRREVMIEKVRKEFVTHVNDLQKELVGLMLNVTTPDFAGVIKGMKSIDSMKDKLDTALANGKVTADQLAADLRAKLAWVKENADDHRALLADLQQLAAKPMDDFALAITSRIAKYKQEQEAKREIERLANEVKDQTVEAVANQQQTPAPAQAVPSQQSGGVFRQVSQIHQSKSVDELPTMKLGQINERIAPISVTADGLAQLGFVHAATDKSAKLYFESNFAGICEALTRHLDDVRSANGQSPAISNAKVS